MKLPRPSLTHQLRVWTAAVGRNVLGWIIILSSFIIGPAVPGPGGIPLFLIGFGLISVPGKRRVVARVLRGMPIPSSWWFFLTLVIVGLILGGLLAGWIAIFHPEQFANARSAEWWIMAPACIPLLLTILQWPIRVTLNAFIRLAPRARRSARPWARKRGITLLPPRRKLPEQRTAEARERIRKRKPGSRRDPLRMEPIVDVHPRHVNRLKRWWCAMRPWLWRTLRLAVVIGVLFWMVKPLLNAPQSAIDELLKTPVWLMIAAAVMFAIFLGLFRASAWRLLLLGMGYRVPIAPGLRIWSMSELARYIPGVIWQVLGRAMLVKPYGVPGSVSSASQILELALFMLANIIVALTCLLAAGLRKIPADQWHWLFIAMGFVPLLLTQVHPKIFHTIVGGLFKRFGKTLDADKLPKRALTAILGWTIVGLLFQAMAVWVLTHSVLELPIAKWYVLAGCWCLAWTIGFSMGFLAPGGIGIRELVFISTLRVFLPEAWVAAKFPNEATLAAFLAFLGVLLRLWAISGELMFSAFANAIDWRRGGKDEATTGSDADMPSGATES